MVNIKCSARNFRRQSKKNCIVFVISVLFLVNTSYAENVGFGYYRKDGAISDVIYFKNNNWVLDVKTNPDNYPVPHFSIISSWISAQNDNDDIDCTKPEQGSYSYISDKHICNFPKKLSRITAEELADLLKTIRPEENYGWQGEYKSLFTPERLEGMRLWLDVQMSGDRQNIPFNVYTKMFWNEPESSLKTWYRVDSSDVVSIEPKYAFVDEGEGDFYCDGVAIGTDSIGMMTNPEGWVSTSNKKNIFNMFHPVARIQDPAFINPNDSNYLAIPKEYEGLFQQIKVLWSRKENKLLTDKQAANRFRNIDITISDFLTGSLRVVYFSAQKYTNEGSGLVIYNGWALLNKDSNVQWINVTVDQMPPDNEKSYFPFATISLNKRTFILVSIHTSTEKGGWVENEVLELVGNKITQPSGIKVVYPGGCQW